MPLSMVIISSFSANSAMRLLTGQMTNLVDRTHHFPINWIMQYFFDKTAIDLEKVDRKMLEVTERRQSRAKVVECEHATKFFQGVDKSICL